MCLWVLQPEVAIHLTYTTCSAHLTYNTRTTHLAYTTCSTHLASTTRSTHLTSTTRSTLLAYTTRSTHLAYTTHSTHLTYTTCSTHLTLSQITLLLIYPVQYKSCSSSLYILLQPRPPVSHIATETRTCGLLNTINRTEQYVRNTEQHFVTSFCASSWLITKIILCSWHDIRCHVLCLRAVWSLNLPSFWAITSRGFKSFALGD